MEYEIINFETINAIPKADIQIVNSFYTRANQVTGEAFQMVFKVALNKSNAKSDRCELPIYIPAVGNYKQEQHLKMLDLFRSGVHWVPIKCHNLKVTRVYNNGDYDYYAHADTFKVVDYSEI